MQRTYFLQQLIQWPSWTEGPALESFALDYSLSIVSSCVHAHAPLLSLIQLFVTLWTIAHQTPLSMGFSGKNIGVGCHILLQVVFLTQGLKLSLLCPLH